MAYIPSECSLEEYERVIYSGDAKNRLYVKHGNTVIGTNGDNNAYPFASKLTIKRRILKNGSKTITLNNFISQEIDLVLHDYKIENLSEEIEIKIGTFIDSVGDYVYVPIGKFLIQDNPTTDKNKTTYKLRDFSVKFDFYYNAKPLIDANGGKVTKLQILHDICEQAGVVCNIKSFSNYDDEIGIYDNSITARTYITYIAEQAGKMASINRYGELVFVDINSDSNIVTGENEITLENAVERNISSFIVEGNSKQQTSSGKNLYNVSDLTWATSNASVDKNGWITITYDNTNGTDIAYRNHWTKNLNIIPSTNYNLIFEIKEVSGEGYLYGTSLGANQIGQFTNTVFNLADLQNNSIVNVVKMSNASWNDTVGLRTFLMIYAGKSASITFRISVLEDTTITPETFEYEPYGVSPSPEYPSEIETVKGYENKLDITKYYSGTYDIFEILEDGWVHYANTSGLGRQYAFQMFEVEPNENYSLSIETKDVAGSLLTFIYQYDKDMNYLGASYFRNSTLILTNPSTKYIMYGLTTDGETQLGDYKIRTSIIKSKKIIDFYVPYGSNYLVNRITGENMLFIPKTNLQYGGTNISTDNGMVNITDNDAYDEIMFNIISLKGDGMWAEHLTISSDFFIKAGTYTLSAKSNDIDYGRFYVCWGDIGATYNNTSHDEIWLGNGPLTFTVERDCYLAIGIYHYAQHPNIVYSEIQLKEGPTANDYKEYKENITTYDLQGNELVKLGNVKDKLDIVTGTLIKRIGKIVLNGSEDWQLNTSAPNQNNTMFASCNVIDGLLASENGMTNMFEFRTSSNVWSIDAEQLAFDIVNGRSIRIRISKTRASDYSGLINWLSNNPVTVYYELAEPQIIQLDKSEIKTFEGTNHITAYTKLETNTTIEYDIKKYVHDIDPSIVESFTAGDTYKVSKVLFEAGVNKFEDGTDDNDTLYLNSDNPYINDQAQITKIYPNLKGFEINSFKTGKILGNPAIDPADLIKIEYDGIIYKTLAQYTLNFSGTMTSTYETTVEHEAKQSNVSNSGMASLKKYVKAELDNVEGKFSIQVGELNDNLDNSIDNVNDRISETDGKLNDTNTNLTSVTGRVTTLEQDKEGWTFDFTTIQNSVKDLDDKTTETDAVVKEIKDYIKFKNGNIILEGTDSKCSVVISKEQITFYTNGNPSAYLSNNELYITDNTVLNKQSIGKWEIKPDDQGNLNTRWIG